MGCMCTLIRMRAYGYCDLHSWPGWRKHEKAKPELKWVTVSSACPRIWKRGGARVNELESVTSTVAFKSRALYP